MTTAYDVLRTELERITQYNRNLLAALNDARGEIAALKSRAAQAPKGPRAYGVFLGRFADGTVDVFTGGRRLRTAVAVGVRPDRIKRGETVLLNDALDVAMTVGYAATGEILTLREVLPDGRRAVVVSASEREHVVYLSDALVTTTLYAGDQVLVDTDAQYAVQSLPGHLTDRFLAPVPHIALARIVGLDEQIARLRDAVEVPLRQRDPGARPATGVLLHGPPGCGKTLLATAFAGSVVDEPGHALLLRAPELFSKYVGETENRLRRVFDRVRMMAATGQTVVLVADDIDSILRARTVGSTEHLGSALVPQFLALFDEEVRRPGVVIIGTTSRADLLDPAVVRPGRLGLKISLGWLDARATFGLFASQLGVAADDADDLIAPVVEMLYGDGARQQAGGAHVEPVVSGATVTSIVWRARSASLRRHARDGGAPRPTAADLCAAATAELLGQGFSLANA